MGPAEERPQRALTPYHESVQSQRDDLVGEPQQRIILAKRPSILEHRLMAVPSDFTSKGCERLFDLRSRRPEAHEADSPYLPRLLALDDSRCREGGYTPEDKEASLHHPVT